MQPCVDEAVCISCGKCLNVCPIINVPVFSNDQVGYAAKTLVKAEQLRGSSGGLFYVMAKAIIENGGAVCGCGTDENLMPIHRIATDLSGVMEMRGSKYVQSNMNDVYLQIKRELDNSRTVLFTGVPCQVAGLRNFLGKEYDELYCVDIICHGVPSRKLYSDYLQWLGDKHSGSVVSYEFRSKKKHKWSLTMRAEIKTPESRIKEFSQMASLDPYYYNFLKGTTYRESCYLCPYARAQRTGDLTIGDFWGVDQIYPELFDINGVSCVLINSTQGHRLWSKVIPGMFVKAVPPKIIIKYNGNLNAPTKRPPTRDVVYKYLHQGGFDAVPYDLPRRARIVDSIKDSIPNTIRYNIKRFVKQLKLQTK